MSDSQKPPESLISRYISNPDGDIYTVAGLPEEVVAVIFAFVSRSPRSFRENIAKVLEEEGHGKKRAAEFHEKWVLNYGHASVAEHASVHLGVERVSRLFSSILELCGEHLSFTEYSQRYQMPRKEDFVVPPEIAGEPELSDRFLSLCARQYDIYERLNGTLLAFLKDKNPDGNERVLEKIAFEDARYALNLAAMTNLGMTANARAVENALVKLLSSEYAEARQRAEEIKREVRFSVPTLVKYAGENPHMVGRRERMDGVFTKLFPIANGQEEEGPAVRLVDWTGRGTEEDPQTAALRKIARGLVYERSFIAADEVEKLPPEKLESIFRLGIEKLGPHDNPHDALKLVSYTAEFVISEACWHQLLRHRKVNWFAKEPCVSFGVTVPPNIKEAGARGTFMEAVEAGEELYGELARRGFPQAASYSVTNAHNRKVVGVFSLWELYHLINLRMSEGAQWDIKETVRILAAKTGEIHPVLVNPALERAPSSSKCPR